MKRKTSSRLIAKSASMQNSKPEWDAELIVAADVLRKKLNAKDAVMDNRTRVQCFKGSQLIRYLMKKKIRNFPKITSQENALEVGSKLIAGHFFYRVARVTTHKKRIDVVLHKRPTVFEADGIYTWNYQGSQTRTIFMSVAMVLFALAICLIKVWPLWMKILVYWVSLVMLITQLSLIALRLVLYALCWIIGFRGYWLFPNMFNDDLYITEALTPLFGKGIEMIEEEEEDDDYFFSDDEEEDDKDEKSNSEGKYKHQTEFSSSSSTNDNDTGDADSSYTFGWINLILITFLGILGCYYIGIFEEENIPDLVASKEELFFYFPRLSDAASQTNQTEYPANAASATDASLDDQQEAEFGSAWDYGPEKEDGIDDSYLDRLVDEHGNLIQPDGEIEDEDDVEELDEIPPGKD